MKLQAAAGVKSLGQALIALAAGDRRIDGHAIARDKPLDGRADLHDGPGEFHGRASPDTG